MLLSLLLVQIEPTLNAMSRKSVNVRWSRLQRSSQGQKSRIRRIKLMGLALEGKLFHVFFFFFFNLCQRITLGENFFTYEAGFKRTVPQQPFWLFLFRFSPRTSQPLQQVMSHYSCISFQLSPSMYHQLLLEVVSYDLATLLSVLFLSLYDAAYKCRCCFYFNQQG
jgi:hypothetical protein